MPIQVVLAEKSPVTGWIRTCDGPIFVADAGDPADGGPKLDSFGWRRRRIAQRPLCIFLPGLVVFSRVGLGRGNKYRLFGRRRRRIL